MSVWIDFEPSFSQTLDRPLSVESESEFQTVWFTLEFVHLWRPSTLSRFDRLLSLDLNEHLNLRPFTLWHYYRALSSSWTFQFSQDRMESLRKFVFKFGRPISDHELPLSFTTNIRVVGLTNNFQLVRTFTFFFTIFNSNIRFYHFYEIDYRTRFLKFQATVNSFLLASQKPTNKFSWDCCKQWCKQGSTHWSRSVLNQSAPWLGNFEILGPEFCSSTWNEFPNSVL